MVTSHNKANGHPDSRGLKKRIKGLRDDWTRFRSNDARASKTLLSRTRLTWQTFPPPQQQLRQVHYSDALEHSISLTQILGAHWSQWAVKNYYGLFQVPVVQPLQQKNRVQWRITYLPLFAPLCGV